MAKQRVKYSKLDSSGDISDGKFEYATSYWDYRHTLRKLNSLSLWLVLKLKADYTLETERYFNLKYSFFFLMEQC